MNVRFMIIVRIVEFMSKERDAYEGKQDLCKPQGYCILSVV